jgi:ankyrin repeat protein
MIRWLVGLEAQLNTVNNDDNTPLCLACAKGNLGAAVELIELGADVDRPGIFGHTPLVWAVVSKKVELARELITTFSAQLDISNVSGETALHVAARTSLEMAELLVESGALATARTSLGRNVLHTAVEGGLEDVVDFFLAKLDFLSFIQPDAVGNQCMHLAAARRNPRMLTHLFGRVVSPQARRMLANATNNLGETPLFKVYLALDRMGVLLEAGALINAVASNGETVLMRTVSSGEANVVRELLKRGADHRLRMTGGPNALEMARARHHGEIVRVLEAWPARLTLVVLRSAALVPRLSEHSQVPTLPTGHLRMLQGFLH